MKAYAPKIVIFLFALFSNMQKPGAQVASEDNCFRHFNPFATGQHNVNQYLVSLVSRLTYPERLGSDLRTDKRRVPVSETEFEEKFKQRCSNWFYNPAALPKEPQLNELTWNSLRLNCRSSFTEAEWTELENLYYTATNKPRPVTVQKPVLASNFSDIADPSGLKAALATNNINVFSSQLGLNPTLYQKTADGRITEMQAFADRGERILQQRQINIPDCQRIRDAFVAEIRRYKEAIGAYRTAVVAYEATLPRIHYIRTNSLQDPEAVLISTPSYILIVFRGTDEYLECYPKTDCWPPLKSQTLFSNLLVTTVLPLQHRNIPGRVHAGWYLSVTKIEAQIAGLLNRYNARNKKVWLAGHSKGAGEAAILSAVLARHYQIPVHGLYTFGGPSSVGDLAFSNFLSNYFNPSGQFRMQRFEVIHDYVASSDLHLLDPIVFGYKPAGARCFYDNITRDGRFFFNKAERNESSKFTDGEAVLSLLTNSCQHIIDNYCRAAYFLLERTNNLRPGLPGLPIWHGSDSKTCTTN